MPRPRLDTVLDQRFERRVVTVVAGPGFGKSTAVSAAVRSNLVSPRGDDCWLGCERADADARHLTADLWAALHPDSASRPLGEDAVRSVTEALWSRAPRHVCLILDDVHELSHGTTGAAFVDELVRALPANGHLLLVSRIEPPVALARLRSHGDVADLTAVDLAFTDDELGSFAALRHTEVDELAGVGGWPALAELAVDTRRDGVDEFLFEEVLRQRTPHAVEVIEALAVIGGADHHLIGDVLERPMSRSDLADTLSDVPMAVTDESGRWTLHPLWTRTIDGRVTPERRGDLLGRAGRSVSRTDPSRAIELLVRTDDPAQLAAAIRILLQTPWADATTERLMTLHRRLPASSVELPEARLLLAAATSTSEPSTAVELLRSVADEARSIGDVELGLLAVERLVVICHRRQDVAGVIDAFARAHELATADRARATALVVLGDALLAEAAGDADSVLEHLDRLRPAELDAYWRAPIAWMRAQALLALGHPEAALAHSSDAVESAPLALRGEVAMLQVNVLAHAGRVDDALALVPPTIALLDEYGTNDARTMARGQAAQRFAMAGRVEAARRHLTAALDLAGPEPSLPVRANLAAAEAIVAIAELDEPRARTVLTAAIAEQPLGVGRQQYHERRRLALSYVLVPATRQFWDTEQLGPAHSTSLASARALVALRDGDVAPAGRLTEAHWADVPATMPMPWIVELAVAGSVAGSDSATLVLKGLRPDDGPLLRHVADTTATRAVARRAGEIAAAMPFIPAHRLRVECLGPLTVRRDGVVVDDPNWRRSRVRALLALLLVHRRVTRETAAAALWPDLDDAAANRNLRVTLSYLHAVLEPGRPTGAAPYFVRTDGGLLTLVDGERTAIDLDEFSAAIARAADGRRHGAPASELADLLEAVDLHRGAYLADLGPEEWLVGERDRLRARFVAAAVRAGELLLAIGDTDRALELADRAVAEEPWSEPARRLLVAAHLAAGDRAAARRALAACRAMLDDLGVDPEPDTEMLARRLDEVS